MNQVIIKVIGNYSYQTSRCLGEGVYGKVYQGMQRQSKQKVAIKKIDLATFTNDKYLENAIFSQIYLLKRFNHPNIVRFKDVLSSKNSLYIITEFCKNGDLKELVKRKRFKEQQAFQIMRQILSGFTELVRQKIIHRDLKPANILIHEGIYKIGDFGFAKYVDNFGSQMLKSCVGSPIYMAPQILQRTPYTTKCDIWSLGVIFYEMIHGCPPWKARDQSQLLRGIKNISITQVLKRSSISSRGSEFLKKTLAFSQQQRIGWSQLFQTYCPKQQKSIQSSENKHNQQSGTKQKQKQKQRERNRVISANSTNNSSPWSTNNLKNGRTNLTPMNTGNLMNRANSRSNLNTNTYSPDKRKNLFSVDSQKKNNHNYHSVTQLQNIKIWRQFCVYYHFYSIQLMLNFSYISNATNKSQIFAKMILSLAMLVKNRSTYCLSLVSSHIKASNKNNQELQKKMRQQHQSYQQVYSDVTNLLQRCCLYKNLRSQMAGAIGHGQVINQERIQKLQNLMLGVANENAIILSEQVRKRAKSLKQFTLVQVLDNVMDILALGLGKSKSLKEMSQQSRNQEEDLKDYVTKVITKVDRLTSNM